MRNAGFTLVEMLIVCAVALIVASIMIPAVVHIQRKNAERLAENEVKEIAALIEQYKLYTGVYPQANLLEILAEQDGQTLSNTTNLGNESLVLALCSLDNGGPYLRRDLADVNRKKLQNLDRDNAWKVALNNTFFTDSELREYVDPWGVPYVYFDNSVYFDTTVHTYTVGGTTFQARPIKDPQGRFYEPLGFQLWSCGPNRVNDQGKGDDITAWVVDR